MVIALIVALLVGLAGGYSLGRGVESTRTITRTVTEPVAVASGHVQARVAFDGNTCSYGGPAAVAAGAKVTFGYDYVGKPYKGTALIIAKADPGTTYEDVVGSLGTYTADDPPEWIADKYEVASSGWGFGRSLTMSLDEGVWAILCDTHPGSMNEVFVGTMLRVIGG